MTQDLPLYLLLWYTAHMYVRTYVVRIAIRMAIYPSVVLVPGTTFTSLLPLVAIQSYENVLPLVWTCQGTGTRVLRSYHGSGR
jgi:hypothetical protein